LRSRQHARARLEPLVRGLRVHRVCVGHEIVEELLAIGARAIDGGLTVERERRERARPPIFVEDEVLKTSRRESAANERVSAEELRKWLENLGDEDLGRYKM
jgi:hypothetical protein